MLNRRPVLAAALVTLAALCSPASQAADAYPAKPLRLVVPFPAGGPTDIIGRTVARLLEDELKQTVVVENRPGAGGNLGTDVVLKSPGDGYTLGIGAISSLAIAPGLYAKLPYNVRADVTPITMVAIAKGAIVAHPSVPFNDLKGLVAYAKANPGKLSYATPGIGTSSHLASEYLQSLAGIDIQHIPYKGTAAAVQDLLGGTVPLSFESSLTTAAPNVASGKLKAIAITAGSRSKLLPNVPTVAEQGYPGFNVPTWFGLIAPAGLPRPIVQRLHHIVVEGLKAPAVVERFASIGAEPLTDSPEQFDAYIREETERWAKVIKAGNIKPE